jgi:hypothetical protein
MLLLDVMNDALLAQQGSAVTCQTNDDPTLMPEMKRSQLKTFIVSANFASSLEISEGKSSFASSVIASVVKKSPLKGKSSPVPSWICAGRLSIVATDCTRGVLHSGS